MEGKGSGTVTGLQPSPVQHSSLSEPQQAEAEAAVTAVAVLGGKEKSGAAEVERAAEELAAVFGGADSEDGAEEMEGELSDSSLISDIPDSQPRVTQVSSLGLGLPYPRCRVTQLRSLPRG
ncbi:UNVERIFIED_CONTAM: hypothetical protein FKN15_040950 [Acipenser sinensis]